MQINPSRSVSIFSNDLCSGVFEMLAREQFQAHHNAAASCVKAEV